MSETSDRADETVAERGASMGARSIDDLRPELVPGVRLHGVMPGVGFTTQQWLIERNQQFLQVSELLYRVAEQMNGTRTMSEIAAAVTETSEWALEATHVHHLIEHKLRPLGLVAGADGQPIAPRAASTAHAPLRLNMRMRMIPTRVVQRLTAVLQYAYAPALLVPIAALIAVAHWWLYSVSGFERGIESSLFQPGALGAILVLAIAAGLFHELGHSAALKYGGGQPRGIGFGLYMVFPAFYSDVTDSYRLGRWARIRTDLGGIYFHLMFAAALIGLSAFTGNQFVLAAAVLFNIEAIRQFIPFIRLDGYWLLADLTGVPDFMSQIGSFVRSLRPGRRYATPLPEFKPWVTVVFGLYLVLSIPALLYVIGLMVMYLPELTDLTQKALAVQTQFWSATQEPLRRVLIALQVVLIPLPLAVTAYFLYLFFSSVVTQVASRFGWSAPGFPVRRLAGATAVAGAVVFAAIALTPAGLNPLGAQSSSPAAAVPDPAALLERVKAATARVQSLEADLSGTLGEEPLSGSIALSRPNRADIQVHGAADSLGTYRVISDGSKLFVTFPDDNKYTEVKASPDGANINAFMLDQVRTFFRPERLTPGPAQQLTYAGREQIDGREYEVLVVGAPATAGTSWRYYISPDDDLVRRIVTTTSREGKTWTRVVQLDNVRLNLPVSDERFRWAPPAGATLLGLDALGGAALPLKSPQK